MIDPTASHGRELLCREVATTTFAECANFDADNVAAPPMDRTAGVTGHCLYRWQVARVAVFDDLRQGRVSK